MSRIETLQCEVSLVKSIQDKMADLLISAPFLSDEEQDLLQRYIDLLTTRSEEMIIFIQVMLKVKQELAYARLDLERAISLNTGVNEGRKRVDWLSERLKKLSRICHNYFYDLQKEISKVSSYEDAYPSCVCGMMKNYVEEGTGDDIQNGVKQVLETCSDVLVYRRGSSVQKIFKPSKCPAYESEVLLNDKQDEQSKEEDEVEVVEKTLNPLSFYPPNLPEETKKNADPLSCVRLRRNEKSKLDSLISYQKQALEQLVEKLNYLYTHMDETPSLSTTTTKVSVEPSTNDTVSSKQLDDSNTKILSDGSLPEIKVEDSSACDTHKMVASVHSDVSDIGTSSSMLIPIQRKESSEHQRKKKEVFPRSPSVWCKYASCSSPNLINHLKDGGTVQLPKGVLAPMKSEKSVNMKRVVNKVKAITKLKMLVNISNVEMIKKKRIQSLLGSVGIQSDNKNIAVDAAKALGELKWRDEKVIEGLQGMIDGNKRKLLVYECAKSMILLGSWHDSAIDVLTYHLKYGNKKVQEDILMTLKKSHHANYIPQPSGALVSLSDAVMNLLDDKDMNIAFNAALSIGYLRVNKEQAKWLLLDSLVKCSYATNYEALNVLVKQMNCQNNDVIDALLRQISSANSWKHRMQAIDLLRDIGIRRLKQYGIKNVFEVLQQLLWNHPNVELKSNVVAVLEEFGLRKEAGANVLKRLNDKSESVRADSIVALITLEMKGERELKMLLDMFDLDSSTHVRTQVIKAFIELKWNHPHVMRVLEDRQKADDVLAKKASKAFNFLRALST